jgi:deoxycytidine triphosphate deaminase
MFLAANEIRFEIAAGNIVIQPFLDELLKPASYVLRFSDQWLLWTQGATPIRLWSQNAGSENLRSATQNELILQPNNTTLSATIEHVGISSALVGYIFNLSHLARFGLDVNLGSSIVSPGFGATKPTPITLELTSFNPTPLLLQTGIPACHIAFSRMAVAGQTARPLGKSIYEGRGTPAGPLLYEEFATILRPPNSE